MSSMYVTIRILNVNYLYKLIAHYNLFFFFNFFWILGFGVHEQSMQDSCVGTHMAVCFSFLLPTFLFFFKDCFCVCLCVRERWSFTLIVQAGVQWCNLGSPQPLPSDSPVSSSQVAGITGMCHHSWIILYF